MRYKLYVERAVSAVVEVDAPDLQTAIMQAEMPGETDDVDPAGEWEVLYAYDDQGQDVPLPTEAAAGQEGDREMLGFGKNKTRHSNGFAMGPGTGPVITPKQRVERARKLRGQGKGTKAGRKGGK